MKSIGNTQFIKRQPTRHFARHFEFAHAWFSRRRGVFCVCLRQTISELATLMEMKKLKVAETVKEHRADELSAMFNLMMDLKRTQRGMRISTDGSGAHNYVF